MASFFGEVLPPRSRIIDDEDLDAIEGYLIILICNIIYLNFLFTFM